MQYLQKDIENDVDFLPAEKVFYKLIVSLCVCVARHTQSTQNKVFYIFAILKKSAKDEVDFSPADTHQRFLQVDTIILVLCGQTCPNYPK